MLGLLKSATANARENHDIDQSELVIDHCYADEDRTLKRFKPRARGRASSIHKRMCHVTIVLRHVPVAAARDISAAQATIAAESRRARAPAGCRAQPGSPRRSQPRRRSRGGRGRGGRGARGRGDRRAQAQARRAQAQGSCGGGDRGEGNRGRGSKARKPRAAKTADAEAPADDEPKAAAPKAPRKKPAAKPTEPAEAADDAAEKTADEGDS